MKQFLYTLVCALALPTYAFAAGFATQSIFLSKDTVTEGDTVLIHTTVTNTSAENFSGTLDLHDEASAIGSVPVTLKAGEADTASLSWKPPAGSHTVTAELRDTKNTVTETTSATFSIAAKPVPASAVVQAPAVDTSAAIQQSIAGISPTIAQDTAPAFTAVDSARKSIAGTLNNGIQWSKGQIGSNLSKGQVLGASTKATPSGIGNTAWTILATISLYACSILWYLVAHAGVFYPILAFLFFYLLWKLSRSMRRSKYSRY